ncbi:glycosyltransferase family 4 protein [Microbacterium sp. LMI12-1-1.1]|uniref:glycosyltransferase family 4 protein n=1 Tax=Microbacterium sp. LMI12-1-1.1 TaxID=3135225 RepID=UPI003429C0FA
MLLSARVYDRQVGGNTRYVRSVYERIEQFGVRFTLGRPPLADTSARLRSALYAGSESVYWPVRSSRRYTALHFPADTGAIVRGKVPIVGTIHGLATLHMEGVRTPRADSLWRSRVRKLARVSDRVITVSQSSADDIAFFEPTVADRISVIHHGIDHDRFNTTRRGDFAATQARLGVPSDYFLYVGNLDPRKNIVALANAAQRVFRATGIPLVVSGSPAWDSEDSLKAVESNEGVLYVGRTSDDDMISLLQNTLAFCFPSLYEGFGFPVLEAMACGAPVICSDRGSLGEVAGQASLMLADVDDASIADAMLSLIEEPRERARLRELGIANAAKFQWSESAAMHADVFREVGR